MVGRREFYQVSYHLVLGKCRLHEILERTTAKGESKERTRSLNLYAMPGTDLDTFSIKALQCVSILSS